MKKKADFKMKKTVLIILIGLPTALLQPVKAQQNCNPDHNTIITGVPYCSDVQVQTTKTIDPNKINNAIKIEDDTNGNINPNIYVYPNINPGPIPPGPLPPPGPYQNNMNRAPLNSNVNPNYYQNYNTPQQVPYQNNNALQYVPNTPQDEVPVEIPGAREFGQYLQNKYLPSDLPPLLDYDQ